MYFMKTIFVILSKKKTIKQIAIYVPYNKIGNYFKQIVINKN